MGQFIQFFLDVLLAEKISIGPPFYQKLLAPFLVLFLLSMAFVPKLRWIKSKIENKNLLFILLIILILLTFLIIKNLTGNLLFYTALIAPAFFSILYDSKRILQ